MAQSGGTNSHGIYKRYGFLKRNGFDWWRHVFTGVHSITGESRTFFIEYFIVNGASVIKHSAHKAGSPAAAMEVSPENAEDTLLSARKRMQDYKMKPAYVLVRSGAYGKHKKLLETVFFESTIAFEKKEFSLSSGKCAIEENKISGLITKVRKHEQKKFTRSSFSGIMSWRILVKDDDALIGIKKSGVRWTFCEVPPLLTGIVHFDNDEYIISNTATPAYVDSVCGKELPQSWFHLSGSNLQSDVSGHRLEKSSFLVHGMPKNKVLVQAVIDGKKYDFNFERPFCSYKCTVDCVEIDEKIHWTISVQNASLLFDIDIFCNISEMLLKTYDSPAGAGKILSFLSGVNGKGELRIYNRIRKGLELIEHIDIKEAFCEYGGMQHTEIL